MSEVDADDPRTYAETSLDRCTVSRTADDGTLIGLPNPYVVPNGSFFDEMYYWDSYFTLLGLLEQDQIDIAKGMVENCFYLLDEYGFVPNANRTYYLTRSQPPLLASMVTAMADAVDDTEGWYEKALPYLQTEYEEYWTVEPHLVPGTGLSRYFDDSGEDEHAEDESGWDLTPRFEQRATEFLPIDLNSYLYSYEQTIADIYEFRGDETASVWRDRANTRRDRVVARMWDEEAGLFFDYDYVNKRQSSVRSLATFVPLWVGMATDSQAERIIAQLDLFEYDGGVVTCDQDYGMPERQWNYPNGWPPLQWIVIEGLAEYGYTDEARRLTDKWIATCEAVYSDTGLFWEKYDVVEGDIGTDDRRYDVQEGFSWTNAVYIALQERDF